MPIPAMTPEDPSLPLSALDCDVRLESAGHFFDLVTALSYKYRRELWFRGEADATWELVAGVYRGLVPRGPNSPEFGRYESGLLRKFLRGGRIRHRGAIAGDDSVTWLFLAQHYRLPTRLLDWTQSAMIAAYFCCIDHERWDTDGCITLLDPLALNRAGDVFGVASPMDTVGQMMAHFAFGGGLEVFEGSESALAMKVSSRVLALEPPELDIRMQVQQSMFTVHPHLQEPGREAFPPEAIQRIIVPAETKERLIRMLTACGLRHSLLFPDLEGLAEELKSMSAPSDSDDFVMGIKEFPRGPDCKVDK